MKEICDVCRKKLSGQIVTDIWGNTSHVQHGVTFCGSCQRILSRPTSAGAYVYDDGRLICGYCKKSAVTDGVVVNRSKRKVLDLLSRAGFHDIPKNIEIVLTNKHTLTNKTDHPSTRGVTLTNTQFSNYEISRPEGAEFHAEKNNPIFGHNRPSFFRYKRVGMVHQIGILYGLPEIEFSGILAHELLHVWQNQNDIKLSPMHTEGFCNLGSFLIYQTDGSELSKKLIQMMIENKDPIYGNGFRLMHKKWEGQGWKGLTAEILANKNGFEGSLWKKIFGK